MAFDRKKTFLRTQYTFGPDSLEQLSKCRVAVFGLGGVGSYTVEALARTGIGALDLIDSDTVSVSNINRQLYALQSTVGLPKVQIAQQRIADINPECIVKTYQTFFLPENTDSFDFSSYDYVVDCIDTVTAKVELIRVAKQNNIPVISCMGAGNKIDPQQFEITDISKTSVCPLARVIRQKLKQLKITKVKVCYSKEKPLTPFYPEEESSELKGGRPAPASNAFTPSVAGLLIAGEVIKDLISIKTASSSSTDRSALRR